MKNGKKKGFHLIPILFEPAIPSERSLPEYGSRSEEDLKSLEERFALTGRLMRLSNFGKAAFGHFQDRAGRIQGYFRRDYMDPRSFRVFSCLDIGDIIGVRGKLFRTRTGELTLMVEGAGTAG